MEEEEEVAFFPGELSCALWSMQGGSIIESGTRTTPWSGLWTKASHWEPCQLPYRTLILQGTERTLNKG